MKFQYQKDSEDDDSPNIFWACDKCRRLNNDLILVGQWRLVAKSSGVDVVCDMCVKRNGGGESKK